MPFTPTQWRELLQAEGFKVEAHAIAPMHLLEPVRLIQDEGILGALRFVSNLLRNRLALQRVLAMRSTVGKYRDNLAAIMLVAVKA